MHLIDTSAWIEFLVGSPTGQEVEKHLPEQNEWLVPTMVQLELSKWLAREVGEDRADQVIAFSQLCRVVDLDTAVALAAAEAFRIHKLASADAIILATARAHKATLVTCDAHFHGLTDVVLIDKKGN